MTPRNLAATRQYTNQLEDRLENISKGLNHIIDQAMRVIPPTEDLENLDPKSIQYIWEFHRTELVYTRWMIREVLLHIQPLKKARLQAFKNPTIRDFGEPLGGYRLPEDMTKFLQDYPCDLVDAHDFLQNILYIAKHVLFLMHKTKPIISDSDLKEIAQDFQSAHEIYSKLKRLLGLEKIP